MYTDLNNDGKVATPTEILWEGQYYPYGLAHKGAWMDTPDKDLNYKYNSIELADDFGLNVNLATFRTLDPATGRWWQVDPKAEAVMSLSPYQSMGNNPISYADPEGDFIPQLVGAVVGGVVNLADQALKGNVTSFGEGLAYFGNGALAGVAVSVGQVGLARGITAVGNKGIQYATGKFDPSGINSFGDVAGLALDVGTDLLSPGLTQAISKPLTKALTPLAQRAVTQGIGSATVTGGGNIFKAGGAFDDIAFSAGFTDEFVVTASRVGTNLSGQGFRSFYAAKQFLGNAGKGNAWHHIVEQGGTNVQRFGAEAIHNTNNLVRLPHGKGTLHNKISGYYSSKQPFTNGKTVRGWLRNKPFSEQYNFGIQKLKDFGWTP